jgi:DNA-binding MarR family transcriptional regulator
MPGQKSPARSRERLLGDLAQAAQRAATDGILFHQAVADRLGLHVSDLRCLNVLLEVGPVPAGEIRDATGLTTGAVTRMVDRLEQAGYVRREADPADRRRVIVAPVAGKAARIAAMYAGMARAWTTVMSDYNQEQLTLILTLFERIHEITRAEIGRLRET